MSGLRENLVTASGILLLALGYARGREMSSLENKTMEGMKTKEPCKVTETPLPSESGAQTSNRKSTCAFLSLCSFTGRHSSSPRNSLGGGGVGTRGQLQAWVISTGSR